MINKSIRVTNGKQKVFEVKRTKESLAYGAKVEILNNKEDELSVVRWKLVELEITLPTVQEYIISSMDQEGKDLFTPIKGQKDTLRAQVKVLEGEVQILKTNLEG